MFVTDEVMSDEEKAMMAEWEAMASQALGVEGEAAGGDVPSVGADDEPGGTRILNQDEIDSLLGFNDGAGNEQASGVMALINSALVNYERLPMLDIVFDRLVRLMSTSLRNLTSDNVEVSLDQVSTVRFGDYMNSIPLPAMLALFKAEEWDNGGLMMVDSALIYSIVDVLLGGRKGTNLLLSSGHSLAQHNSRTNLLAKLVMRHSERHHLHHRRMIH